ncbi:MAG: hypothetical protein DMG88_20625, partial [Acidobacteria bacterium]
MSRDLRGAKAPLYHSAAGFHEFFGSLVRLGKAWELISQTRGSGQAADPSAGLEVENWRAGMKDCRHFYIDGKWVRPANAHDFVIVNPATEQPIATISL